MNTNPIVSIYNRYKHRIHPIASAPLFDWLLSDRYKTLIEALQAETDPARRARLKNRIDGITVSANFPKRRRKVDDHHPTGFICLDMDGKDNYRSAQSMKRIASGLAFVRFAATSSSGKGAFCIVSILFKSDIRGHYLALEEYFDEELSIRLDGACKDITRIRYGTYDPDPYYVEECEDWEEVRQTVFVPKHYDNEIEQTSADAATIVEILDSLNWTIVGFNQREARFLRPGSPSSTTSACLYLDTNTLYIFSNADPLLSEGRYTAERLYNSIHFNRK